MYAVFEQFLQNPEEFHKESKNCTGEYIDRNYPRILGQGIDSNLVRWCIAVLLSEFVIGLDIRRAILGRSLENSFDYLNESGQKRYNDLRGKFYCIHQYQKH